MKKETKMLYEGMFIINSMLSEEARSKALEKVVKGITDFGGEVRKTFQLGRRKLAYEVAGRREGYYYLFYFDVAPAAISEMWKEYKLNEDLIRFITLRTDTVRENLEFKPLVQQ